MTRQVLTIGGGDTFESREDYLDFLKSLEIDFERYKDPKDSWRRTLREKLGEGYEVIDVDMPNKLNAKYEEWKIWFEKFLPYIRDGVILVGHSLGGTFLAKYLSEGRFPKKIEGLFLVSAVYEADTEEYSLASFTLPDRLNIDVEKIYLYHSEDDPIVPVSDIEQYMERLPQATARLFKDRKHFTQEEFPELVEDIKSL